MKLLLAPMEGLLDHTLRDMLTRLGGVDLCVSEFIRVTNTVLPRRAFIRVAPELLNNSRTPAGVPVRVQLLGSDPICLADNAAALAELNPYGIDLNFGCPAKTVNQHRGGAVLLDEPELVGQIVAAVRRAVPAHIPVSAKMRLGYNDDSRAEDCAQAIEAAGASDLVVHARTKAHGYRPPAYWDRIADLRQHVRLPMVANGEIWTVADALRCREVTGCERLMIGRGMVADPGLALAIARHDAAVGGVAGDLAGGAAFTAKMAPGQSVAWSQIVGLMRLFWVGISQRVAPRHRAGRLKQWLNYMRRVYPEAQQAFDQLRLVHDAKLIENWLSQQSNASAP
ncbi:tRNA-dihydrouridine synthase [Limnohabitans sp. DM1]|uniref:tRNA dihydrouridine synthase n=1 Tax=Limnohabitans sp. DM1 TaxID=1597955 RepID=UPI000A868D09|nr:tRNA-dihydrouridine synthase [Limnohabitans sp. DM1]